jgi:hypothetical protein
MFISILGFFLGKGTAKYKKYNTLSSKNNHNMGLGLECFAMKKGLPGALGGKTELFVA